MLTRTLCKTDAAALTYVKAVRLRVGNIRSPRAQKRAPSGDRTTRLVFSDPRGDNQPGSSPMTAPDPNARPPFWRHRYYYLALKIIVLLCAVYFTLQLAGYP
jgi:hypothetical protein